MTKRRTIKSLCHVLYSGQVNGEKVWLIVYDSYQLNPSKLVGTYD